MKRLSKLFSRFRRDESGVFAVLFAVLAIVLIATSGAVVDFTKVQQARTRAQTGLDAATLALQSRIDKDTTDQLKVQAGKILTEQLDDSTITATIEKVTKDLQQGKLNIQASIVVPTAFVQLVGINTIQSYLVSEVTRSSSDLEVSVALDVTKSMDIPNTKIAALISATNALIDDLVKTQQTPTYSKMALAPYSNAVNVGSYADKARGAVVAGKPISTVTWASGSALTISAITKANPAVVTTSATHGLVAGDSIYINGITGMTQITAGIYCVGTVSVAAKTFQLKKFSGTNCNTNVNSSSYSTYTGSAGRVTKCLNAVCELTVTTSANHGFANGAYVHITGVGNMASSTGTSTNTLNYNSTNKKLWVVKAKTDKTFIADGSTMLMFTNATSSATGGTATCTLYGCAYYRYRNADGNYNLHQPNTCVVERPTTSHAADDTNPTTAPVGYHYPDATGTACLTVQIQPLTSDKAVLHTLVNKLKADGSTAGQIGLAWAWYMLSPNFVSSDIATVWPANSVPAAYGKKNLVKAVILMTDGIFNTMFEHGVPSKDSDTLSGGTNIRSYNNSPNGGSIAQAKAICTAIKAPANDTLLFTVGFDIGSNSQEDKDARAFLSECATPGGYFYQANTAADLNDAFKKIAQSLSDLRLSK